MLFLPAAALCCLCSALGAMATQLVQDLTLTKRTGQSVSISCGGTGQCGSNAVTWYQKKKTETYKAILYISIGGSTSTPFNHPQEAFFSAERDQSSCSLKLKRVTPDYQASYYCGCYKSNEFLFGSGTKLYVAKKPVVPPEVTVCPVKTKHEEEGKAALMCLASAMFPPDVQFSWKRKRSEHEEPLPADKNELTMTGIEKSAAIRLVNNDHINNYIYICVVKHENKDVTNQTQLQAPPPPKTTTSPAATPGSDPPAASVPPQLKLPESFQSQSRVKLLCLLYTVLIVKSLVYCSGLSLLMMLRNKEPST